MLDVFRPDATTQPIADEAWSKVGLTFVLSPATDTVYVEWPETEPMVNVIAGIHLFERGTKDPWRVVFDLEDDDLLEVLVGGYRLHGMFLSEIIGEE